MVEVPIEVIEAHDKYNKLYDNQKYMAISATIPQESEYAQADLGVIVQDCALMLCGHTLISQFRWLDLFFALLHRPPLTRQATLAFLSIYRPLTIEEIP